MGKRIGRAKARKLMGQGKSGLISQEKVHVQAKENKEFVHCFLSAGRCSAISRKAGLHHA